MNARAGFGTRKYTSTFVFENDFAALKKDAPRGRLDVEDKGLLVAEGEPGICRVMCFSPRHDLTLSSMSVAEIEEVVRVWSSQFAELAAVAGNQPRADFREPRRDDGGEQSASALPNLGNGFDS